MAVSIIDMYNTFYISTGNLGGGGVATAPFVVNGEKGLISSPPGDRPATEVPFIGGVRLDESRRETRPSSSCVSLMYSIGGRGASGGGTVLELGPGGGGGEFARSWASYLACNSAFSSIAVRILEPLAAPGTGGGLGED